MRYKKGKAAKTSKRSQGGRRENPSINFQNIPIAEMAWKLGVV